MMIYLLSIILGEGSKLLYTCHTHSGGEQNTLHTSAWEPCVWICINKQLHLEQVSDFLWVEHEDALKQDHIGRIHRNKLVFPGTTHSFLLCVSGYIHKWDLCQCKLITQTDYKMNMRVRNLTCYCRGTHSNGGGAHLQWLTKS